MSKFLSQKIILAIIIISGAVVLFYTITKAAHSSFTHDESYTYNNYVNHSIWFIISGSFNHPDIPNNHILNSVLMKFSQHLFGSSEFALRLPNLLAHIFYMIFTFLWLKKLKNHWVLLVGFIVLNINPYLLDFFTLARGYGLGSCLMFLSFYFFYNFIEGRKTKDNIYSFIFAALSVLGNFTLLNYYVSLWIIFNLFVLSESFGLASGYAESIKKLLRFNIPPLIITSFLAIIIYNPLSKIHDSLPGEIHGFWSDTVIPDIFCSTESRFAEVIDWVCIFIKVVIIASFLLGFYSLWKSKLKFNKSHNLLILFILLLPALSTIIQHALFGTPFLTNRTGIIFIVLFNINFCYLIYYLFENFKSKIFPILLSLVYSIFLIINFIVNFNYGYYPDYYYDAFTKKMLTSLEKDYRNSHDSKAKVSLGITWIYEPIINYYRATKHLDWLNEVNREGYKTGKFDYYYVLDDSAFIASNHKIIIENFFDGKSILAKNP